MFILQIAHPVPNFASWKKTFDSDPLKRKESGVKRYRISRGMEDSNLVFVELEFESLEEAQKMNSSLIQIWGKVEGTLIMKPESRIVEVTETVQY
jgi:hypothetical protein